jgi:hypothetical protein
MTTSPELLGSLPLDGHHGPASRITRMRAAEIVERAMRRADARESQPQIPSRRWRNVALLGAASLASAALLLAAGLHLAAPQKIVAPRLLTSDVSSSDVQLGAAQMLQKADGLRAQHQWLAATELYEQTLRAYPNEADAYRAMVAAGRLRLEHLGDTRGALGLLSAAILARPHDALSEEARFARIEALRELGDRFAERQSIDEFVALYPDGALATRARELRQDLDQVP